MDDKQVVELLLEKIPVDNVRVDRHVSLRALGEGVAVATIMLYFDERVLAIPMDLPFDDESVDYVVEQFQGTLARA